MDTTETKQATPETDCLLLTEEAVLPPELARADRRARRTILLGAALALLSAGLFFHNTSFAKGRALNPVAPLISFTAAARAATAITESQLEACEALAPAAPARTEGPASAPSSAPAAQPAEAPKARQAPPRRPVAQVVAIPEEPAAAPAPIPVAPAPERVQPPSGQWKPTCRPDELICNLETQPEEPTYPASLSQQEIERAVRGVSFDSCRNVGRGKVAIFGTFDASGKVTDASAAVVGAEDNALATCAALRLRSTARFPRLSGGTQSFLVRVNI
jgi:hypothetical protein